MEIKNNECYKCIKVDMCKYVNIPHSKCYRKEEMK